MIVRVILVYMLGLGVVAVAPRAADADVPVDSAERAPVRTDPETGERYLEVRPDAPLERGRWPVAPWVPWTVGGIAALLAGTGLVRRATADRSRAR